MEKNKKGIFGLNNEVIDRHAKVLYDAESKKTGSPRTPFLKKGQVAQVIQYEGGNSTFIFKHECEDFYTGTQLIVHESQEAVFFLNGQALDLFGPGRHTLTTQNLPLISRLFGISVGGATPFHCEVYFINKTEQMSIKWGTDSKAEYTEPTYGFPIKLGARGEMNLRVEDSRRLLVKVVGTEKILTQVQLVSKFRAFLMTRFKSYLTQLIKNDRISIFDIDERLSDISCALHEQLKPDFSDYGVSLERFFVTDVAKPEDDPNYIKFKELHFRQYADIKEAKLRQQLDIIEQQTQAERIKIEAEALAAKRRMEGYTYQDERGFDVAERIASNEAVGQLNNIGIGLGTMMGVGGAVSGAVGNIMQNTLVQPSASDKRSNDNISLVCQKCGSDLPANAKFCLNCGSTVEPPLSPTECICPKCGNKTHKGKFCMECGSPLINTCPDCGSEVPAGGKFCLNCGKKLL